MAENRPRVHHHGYLWTGPKDRFDEEALRRPPHPEPFAARAGLSRRAAIRDTAQKRRKPQVTWGFLMVSEGGLEPPRPIKGTSTSS